MKLQTALDTVEEDDSAANVNDCIAICNELIENMDAVKSLSPYHLCGLHTKAVLILQHHSANHQHLHNALSYLETIWGAIQKKSVKEDPSALFQVDVEEVAFHLFYCMYRLNSFQAALDGLNAFLKSHFGSVSADNGPQFQHLRAQLLYNLEQYPAAAAIYEETLDGLNEDLEGADGDDEEALLAERSEAVTNLSACFASMPNANFSAALKPHLGREEDGGSFEQHLNVAMSCLASNESNPLWWAESVHTLYEAEAALKRAHEDTELTPALQAAFQKRLSELSVPLAVLRRFSQKADESVLSSLWSTASEHLAAADPVCALVLEGSAELDRNRSFLADYCTLLLHRGVLLQLLERCSGVSSLRDASIQCYSAIQAIRPRGVVITAVAAVNHALLLSSSANKSADWHYDAIQAIRYARTTPVTQRLTKQQQHILSFNNALLHLNLGNHSGAASAALDLLKTCTDEGIQASCIALLCDVSRISKKNSKKKFVAKKFNRKNVAKKLGSNATAASRHVLALISAQHHAGCFAGTSQNAIGHLTAAAKSLQEASTLDAASAPGISTILANLLIQSPPPKTAKTADILPTILKTVGSIKPGNSGESAALLTLLVNSLLVVGPSDEVTAAVEAAVKNAFPETVALQNLAKALAAPTTSATKATLVKAGMWPAPSTAEGVAVSSILPDEAVAEATRRLPSRSQIDGALFHIVGSLSSAQTVTPTVPTKKTRHRKRPCKAITNATKSGTAASRPDPERWIALRDRPSYQELPARRRRELHRIRAAAEAEKRKNAEKRRLGQQ